MSRKKAKAKPWQLGGARAPAWLRAFAVPHVKARTREDLVLLRERLQVESLPSDHPLKVLWLTSDPGPKLAETRFQMHHLADDLRQIEGVQGASLLTRAMTRDAQSYSAYRYELRVAAALARSTGQRVLSLGGKAQGPDIVVETRSGHRCGIACYRAETATPTLTQATSSLEVVAKNIVAAIASMPLYNWRLTVAVTFPGYPVAAEDCAEAVELFTTRWRSGEVRPDVGPRGVKFDPVEGAAQSEPGPFQLALHVPISAHEKRRVTGKVNEKLLREADVWARNFDGPTIMLIEESDFCAGLDEDDLKDMVREDAPHPFAMVVRTWPSFIDSDGRRTPIEYVRWSSRAGGDRLDVGLGTFSDNFVSWTKEHLAMEYTPRTARMHWKIERAGGTLHVRRMSDLALHRRIVRVPWPDPTRTPTADDLEPIIAGLVPELPRR